MFLFDGTWPGHVGGSGTIGRRHRQAGLGTLNKKRTVGSSDVSVYQYKVWVQYRYTSQKNAKSKQKVAELVMKPTKKQ